LPPRQDDRRVAFEHALRWVRSAPVQQDEDVAAPANPWQSIPPDTIVTDRQTQPTPNVDASDEPLPPTRMPVERKLGHKPPATRTPAHTAENIVEEDTVMLSIGAIHVRLEAPQPPATPHPEAPRRADPAPSRSSHPTLATGLRRRCIHL